ncbi:transposase [Streptomyces niveus]|uniref:transposase n=1 Tax=Streptomyces niveus TaxID=193462 RepID=UPI0036D84AC6
MAPRSAVVLGGGRLDSEQYPAAELVALYRERWEIELAFDEIKNPCLTSVAPQLSCCA